MGLDSFLDKAPCRDSDPWLFDQWHIDLAQPALNICRDCPFWKECDEWVQPKANFYDGVVGGKLWRNGRILAKLVPTSPNTLIVGEEPELEQDTEAMDIRGSELRGDWDGDVFPRGENIYRRELQGEEGL